MGHTPLLDLRGKHPALCPHCQAQDAVFLVTPELEGFWKCAACGLVWRANEHVTALFTTTPKTIH